MSWYAFDSRGWYTGIVPDGTPSATPVPPPSDSQTEVAGELRARWVRYAWRLQAYAPAAELVAPVAYGIDADGWYTGTAEVGSIGSVTAPPPITATTTTPGEPRARWQGGWAVMAYPAPPEPHITRLAFISRFTDAEAIAIDLASQGATQEAAAVRRYLAKVNTATYIDLSRADTRGGVQALGTAGLLAAGRALEILDAPILDSERFTQ